MRHGLVFIVKLKGIVLPYCISTAVASNFTSRATKPSRLRDMFFFDFQEAAKRQTMKTRLLKDHKKIF